MSTPFDDPMNRQRQFFGLQRCLLRDIPMACVHKNLAFNDAKISFRAYNRLEPYVDQVGKTPTPGSAFSQKP
ncbi:hypothetical protein ALP46_200104 [Pseudomonas amygdali pv. myricae]|nr:hypothetical protein ALP46_200104 [Pseudomonas amygdali pv. myricae]